MPPSIPPEQCSPYGVPNDDADVRQALRPALPPGWGLVTPQGPHPGHPWGYGPGWAWYRYVEEDRVDALRLEHGPRALDTLGLDDPISLELQVDTAEEPERGIVVDDQHRRRFPSHRR